MNDVTAAQPAMKASGAFFVETVTWVQHWTETLFSFRTTRDPALRFASARDMANALAAVGKFPFDREDEPTLVDD